jgi:hypothetical protein
MEVGLTSVKRDQPLAKPDLEGASMFGIFSAIADPPTCDPRPSSRGLTPANRQRLEALRPGARVRNAFRKAYVSAPSAAAFGSVRSACAKNTSVHGTLLGLMGLHPAQDGRWSGISAQPPSFTAEAGNHPSKGQFRRQSLLMRKPPTALLAISPVNQSEERGSKCLDVDLDLDRIRLAQPKAATAPSSGTGPGTGTEETTCTKA